MFKHEEEEEGTREPKPGQNVRLALDSRIQVLAEQALTGERGAAIVMNPANGDVLAMASSPIFDPNAFSTSLSAEEWRSLSEDEDQPLFNRAISGVYPPGSVFKPVVAIAAIENRRATAETEYNCPGVFEVGGVPFPCWLKPSDGAIHGLMKMRKGIEQSCNCYFYQLGLQCGYERIYHMAEALGLGAKTGIELDGEASGLLPDNNWKLRTIGESWRAGDTCNASIGQGMLAFTPLQIAAYVAALANGGYLYRPRLVLDAEGDPARPVNDLRWSPETLDVIRGGMRDVVEAPNGTGRRAKIPGVQMAGKTGTRSSARAAPGRSTRG